MSWAVLALLQYSDILFPPLDLELTASLTQPRSFPPQKAHESS
jgi:hypothetical protein